MNTEKFFEHWGVKENPFRAEEARHDAVFTRMNAKKDAQGSDSEDEGDDDAHAHGLPTISHPHFGKIAGDLAHPASAVVFGDNGSGKTAIRMQMAHMVRQWNAKNPDDRVLLVSYDDHNALLDAFVQHMGISDSHKALSKFELVDHIDALLHTVVPPMTDALLGDLRQAPMVTLQDKPSRVIRKISPMVRRELLLLQSVYDRPHDAAERTPQLRNRLKIYQGTGGQFARFYAKVGWVLPVAAAAYGFLFADDAYKGGLEVKAAVGALLALWVFAYGTASWARMRVGRLGRALGRAIRIIPRSGPSYAQSLAAIPHEVYRGNECPKTRSDDHRYALLAALKRGLGGMAYKSLLVVVDRVDEPTIISGDTKLMKAFVWPMFNNKFLQWEGSGIKMLLPAALRNAVFRESHDFFQEARLDKQNMIERLDWTGTMLYDLCNARMQACQKKGTEPLFLIDLFDEDVNKEDIIEGLALMKQPRDAFKFVYQCLTRHCGQTTAEDGNWRIPKIVLQYVRDQQVARLAGMTEGTGPG